METKTDMLRNSKPLPSGTKLTPRQLDKRLDRLSLWISRYNMMNCSYTAAEQKHLNALRREWDNLMKRNDRLHAKKIKTVSKKLSSLPSII